MSKSYFDVIGTRRSQYSLGKREITSPERVRELLERALQQAPSAFNHQPGRVVLLTGEGHTALWDIVWSALQASANPAHLTGTKKKLDAFAAGWGTILYFIDEASVKGMQEQFSNYADKFPVWAQQAAGILQYAVWCSLHAEGLGASLQHYNPLIDNAVREKWSLPAEWQLVAQMPFGSPEATPGPKDQIDPAGKLLVFPE